MPPLAAAVSHARCHEPCPLHTAVAKNDAEAVAALLAGPRGHVLANSQMCRAVELEFDRENQRIHQVMLDDALAAGHEAPPAPPPRHELVTPLIAAVRAGYAGVVVKLLRHPSVDVNKRSEGADAMHPTQRRRRFNRHVPTMPPFLETPLVAAIRAGHTGIAEALLDHADIDVNKPAGRHYEVEGVHSCYESYKMPLHLAVQHGNLSVVRRLVAAPAIQVNGRGNGTHERETPLFCAVKSLANPWSDVGARNEPDLSLVRALLGARALVPDAGRPNRPTPLQVACKWGLPDCVRALLLAGASPHATWKIPCSRKNKTALDMVCKPRKPAAGEPAFDPVAQRQYTTLVGISESITRALVSPTYKTYQRKRHASYSWGLRQAVATLLLVGQRLERNDRARLRLPQELWLLVCSSVRVVDFRIEPAAPPAPPAPVVIVID